MKKKLVCAVLVLALALTSVFVLVSCAKTLPSVSDETIAAAENMTMAQLLEEAKKETGDFVAYGNTSRITTAMDNFIKSEWGKALNLTDKNATAVKKNDSEIYELLSNESKSKSNAKNASMVLIQDSASLELQRTMKDPLVKNYVNKEFKDKVDEANRLPLAHQFINKLFMYNVSNENNVAKFTNVWQLTESKYKDKIFFKSPTDEQVNMNFLIMLTSPEWSAKLETAYKALYNKEDADVGAGKKYENYGYKWIAEFIANCNFSISSDTTIASKLSSKDNEGKMGLFVLSKLRDASVYGENLQVSAWDKEEGASNYTKIDPFAGFMYSIYAQLAAKGPRPYTAMLFINYLMTEEGFTPWKSLGGYSANKDVPVYEGSLSSPKETTLAESTDKFVYVDNNKAEMILTKSEKVKIDGKDVTIKTYTYLNEDGTAVTSKTVTDKDPATGKATKIDVKGVQTEISIKNATIKGEAVKDSPLSFWAENLVIENGTYINSVKATAMDWINKLLAGK